MGWAFGVNPSGREVGYGVAGVCDEEGCEVEIDLGLAYACGGMHGDDEYGCEDYFCGDHLFFGGSRQMCKFCQDTHEALPASECHPDHFLACGIHDDWRDEHESLGWDECMDEGCEFHEDEHAESAESTTLPIVGPDGC